MATQEVADRRTTLVLGLLLARRTRHEIAMLQLELEDSHLARGMRRALSDAWR